MELEVAQAQAPPPPVHLDQMHKEDSESILAKAKDTVTEPITDITEAAPAETAEEPVNQQTKVPDSPDSLIAAPTQQLKQTCETVPAETAQKLKDVPTITSRLETRLLSATPNPTQAEEEQEEAEQNMTVELSHATPATETENHKELAQVDAEEPEFRDTSVEAEDKETESVEEEIKEFEFPVSSPAATPVVESKPSEAAAVTEVHTEKEKTPEELTVEKEDASPVLAETVDVQTEVTDETVDVETEVTAVLPEKKKKRALGDHLAEEKANDSVKNANKQASDEKCKVQLPQVEQMANAVAPTESTEISSRDVNTIVVTKTEADENMAEKEKVVENAAPTGDVTATEVAQAREDDKVAEKEPVAAGETGKEEVARNLTSRRSNNILSKVKHQIVKVKKAIVRKSPSSKNMKVEKKDDIKVN